MLDEDLELGDLGIVDPERPLPRRAALSASGSVAHVDGANAAVVISGSTTKRFASVSANDLSGPTSASVDWVSAVQNWQPIQDLATRSVEVDWAVEGLVPSAKVGALVAAGGTGKTTLMLILFVCIATGRPFFGRTVREGSSVMLTNDDSQSDVVAALSRVCRAMALSPVEFEQVGARVRIVSLQGDDGLKTFTTSMSGAVAGTTFARMLIDAVAGIEDLVGVSLDTLRQFCGGNSNDEQVIKITIAGATQVATKTGAFVIFPHHTGKQNFREGVADMYCGSGSAAIADNCRFVLLLQTTTWKAIGKRVQRGVDDRGSPLVLTSTRGSLLVKAPPPMFLFRDGFEMGRLSGVEFTAEQQEVAGAGPIMRAVASGAKTKNAIYEIVKGRKAVVLKRVDDLVAEGHLVASAAGMSVTDKGRHLLS